MKEITNSKTINLIQGAGGSWDPRALTPRYRIGGTTRDSGGSSSSGSGSGGGGGGASGPDIPREI